MDGGEIEKDDEIALASLKIKGRKEKDKPTVTFKTPDEPKDIKDTALFTKGKGGKGNSKG